RFALRADDDRAVRVELDVAAVGPAPLALGTHDHRARRLALLDLAVGQRFLDADDDHVTELSVAAARPSEHLDALHHLGAGVVGHIQYCLDLNHGYFLTVSRERLVRTALTPGRRV